MKIVVTGALGFVGTNLCLHFLSKGSEVIAIDNRFKNVGGDQNLELISTNGARFCHVDIRNWNDVETLFKNENNIDAVLHMAAQVAFKRSVESPRLDFEINALGTFNLLESVRLYQPETTFLCASTNQVYGELKNIPVIEKELRYDYVDLPYGVAETFPMDFLSPYGCSKGSADQYTLDYARIYNLRTVVTRFGGIYGDHQYSNEDHGWVSFMTQMVLQNKPFNRFGHGKQVRDILYVSDIVEAVELCVDNINNISGQAINIAGGHKNSISVLELLQMLEKLTGNKEKSIVNSMRKGDKLVCYLDIRKAQELLGWEPKVGKEEGLKRLINWMETLL